MQHKHLVPMVALFGLILLVLGGYFFIASPKTESPQQSQQAGSLQVPQGKLKTFTVVGTNYAFEPAEIRVKNGDTVTITFENKLGYHDLLIDEVNVFTRQLPPGQKETVTFIASKSGTFEYYCSIANHRQMGMVGKLIVE
jgi:plastocyanin